MFQRILLKYEQPIEHFEIKLFCNVDCLKTRSDLECLSPAFQKHVFCKNANDTKQSRDHSVQICFDSVVFLWKFPAFIEHLNAELQVQPRFCCIL